MPGGTTIPNTFVTGYKMKKKTQSRYGRIKTKKLKFKSPYTGSKKVKRKW